MKIVVIGGTGLIGSKLVQRLRDRGHDVLAAAPNTGVNTITREGLAEAVDDRVRRHHVVDGGRVPLVPHLFEPAVHERVAVGRHGKPPGKSEPLGGVVNLRSCLTDAIDETPSPGGITRQTMCTCACDRAHRTQHCRQP